MSSSVRIRPRMVIFSIVFISLVMAASQYAEAFVFNFDWFVKGLTVRKDAHIGRDLTVDGDVDVMGAVVTSDLLVEDGDAQIDGKIEANFFKAGEGNRSIVNISGWYRIAENSVSGKRASAEFTVRDEISGAGHSSLKFRAGISFNYENGISVTVLGHSRYSSTVFPRIRILESETENAQYLDVYVNKGSSSGSVEYSITDNLSDSGWTPVDWILQTEIPSNYVNHVYSVDKLFSVADSEDRFSISRGGRVGIGTSAPETKLHVEGNVIADEPTKGNHLATKSYVDASTPENTIKSVVGDSGIVVNTADQEATVKLETSYVTNMIHEVVDDALLNVEPYGGIPMYQP